MGCGSSSASTGAVADSSQSSLTPLPGSKGQQLAQLEIPGVPNGYSNGLLPRGSLIDDPGGYNLNSQRPSFQYSDGTYAEQEEDQKLQYICDTDVSLEWLYQRLTEKFKCEEEPEPQWIAERLNTVGEKDLDQTTVLRVTFGWENEKLPKSVVLKICVQQSENATDDMKLASRMFKRECSAYEWLSKQKKLPVPKIFVIKKQATEAGNGVVIMEDLSERAQVGVLANGMCVEAVRDLLRNLAQIHALSLKSSDWTTMVAENSPFFYKQTSEFTTEALKAWPGFDEQKAQLMSKYQSAEYMADVVAESSHGENVPRCLVHGNPAAHSVFLSKEDKIAALLDWTQAHPGCYAEDVTKAICWNLSPNDRHENLLRLLEYYHFNLLKYHGSALEQITLEQVKKHYQEFFPFVAITFLLFLPEEVDNADKSILDRAQSLIDDTLALNSRPELAEIPVKLTPPQSTSDEQT